MFSKKKLKNDNPVFTEDESQLVTAPLAKLEQDVEIASPKLSCGKSVLLATGFSNFLNTSKVVVVSETNWRKFHLHPNFWLVLFTLFFTIFLSPSVMYDLWADSLPKSDAFVVCDVNGPSADTKLDRLREEFLFLSNYYQATEQVNTAKRRVQQAQAALYFTEDRTRNEKVYKDFPSGCNEDVLRNRLMGNVNKVCPRTVCQEWSVEDTVTGDVTTTGSINLRDEFPNNPYEIRKKRRDWLKSIGINPDNIGGGFFGWAAGGLVKMLGNLNQIEGISVDVFELLPKDSVSYTVKQDYAQDVEYAGTVCKEIIEPCPSTEGLEQLIEFAGYEQEQKYNLESLEQPAAKVSVVVNDGIQKAIDLLLYRMDIASLLYNGYLIFILMLAPPLIMTQPSFMNRVVGSALNPGKATFVLVVVTVWFGLEFLQTPEVKVWYQRISADSCQVSIDYNKRRANVVTEVCNSISKMKEDLNSYRNTVNDLIIAAKTYQFCDEDTKWYDLKECVDDSVEVTYPFDFPNVWQQETECSGSLSNIGFNPVIPDDNSNIGTIFNGTSELPADFLNDFGFESAKIELRQKLVASCDARSLLEATFIESDEFPVAFVVIIAAVGVSALLGPCVSIMLRHLFAWKYPIKALYRGKVEVFMLPSQLKESPDDVLNEIEKDKIRMSAEKFVKLQHGVWAIISILLVLTGIVARSGIFYQSFSPTATEENFDNMLSSANAQPFEPPRSFVNGGCYKDEQNDLGNIVFKPNVWNGLDDCRRVCKDKFNSSFYGAEGGNRCRCSNFPPDADRLVDSSECDKAGCISKSYSCEGFKESIGLMGGKDRVTMYEVDYFPYYQGVCYDNTNIEGKLELVVQDSEWKEFVLNDLVKNYGQDFSSAIGITETDIDDALFNDTVLMTHDECRRKCAAGLNRYYTLLGVNGLTIIKRGVGRERGYCRCLATNGAPENNVRQSLCKATSFIGCSDVIESENYDLLAFIDESEPLNTVEELSCRFNIYDSLQSYSDGGFEVVTNERGCYVDLGSYTMVPGFEETYSVPKSPEFTPLKVTLNIEECQVHCRDIKRKAFYFAAGINTDGEYPVYNPINCYCSNTPFKLESLGVVLKANPGIGKNGEEIKCLLRGKMDSEAIESKYRASETCGNIGDYPISSNEITGAPQGFTFNTLKPMNQYMVNYLPPYNGACYNNDYDKIKRAFDKAFPSGEFDSLYSTYTTPTGDACFGQCKDGSLGYYWFRGEQSFNPAKATYECVCIGYKHKTDSSFNEYRNNHALLTELKTLQVESTECVVGSTKRIKLSEHVRDNC